jgi:hypothetical protein
MDQLKKIGQLCRQHYEKLILVFVLLLLAGAVWYLFQQSQVEADKTRSMTEGFRTRAGTPVEPVKLDRFTATMKVVTNPPALNFSGQHNLLNPVKWQQPRGGGQIIKVVSGAEIGPGAMRIAGISPLHLSVAFDRPAKTGADVTGYHIVVTNELATLARLRRQAQYVQHGATNTQVFVLTEVKGPPDEPTELVARLRDFNNETISFAPGKPYTRVVGHEAELVHPSSGKKYPRLRKDSPLDIEGEPYKVVDIAPNRVVVSDDSNGKRHTIEQMAAP